MKKLCSLFRILVFNILFFMVVSGFSQMYPPENFYVTPVGKGTWDSIQNDDFQFYKIFLNGVYVTDSDSINYQYGSNGEELDPDESYLAEIAAMYNDGFSEKVGFEFVYLPCDSFPPHSYVDGYVENNMLYFVWNQIEEDLNQIFVGTNFYFENEFMESIPASDTFFTFPDPGPGYYDYCFRRVYSFDNGDHYWESCEGLACILDAGYCPDFFPPRNLEVVDNTNFQNPTICWLEWDEPNGFDPVWLQYDDGVNVDGIGGQTEFFIAAKWDTSQLEGFDGTTITKVKFFPREPGSTFMLKIWRGENASILLHEQSLPNIAFNTWNEINLTIPVEIDVSEELWIGYHVISNGYPAGCGNFTGSPNSDLISFDGVIWERLSDYDLLYSWNLSAYVEAAKNPSKSNDFLGYLVYREDDLITDTIQGLSYVDTISEYNYPACYQVQAVYEMGMSEPSNEACTILLPAISEDENQSISLYPNPVQTDFKIESKETIFSLKIYNQTGQELLSFENINSKEYKINLNHLENGLYIIEINSNNKTQIQKLIIQK